VNLTQKGKLNSHWKLMEGGNWVGKGARRRTREGVSILPLSGLSYNHFFNCCYGVCVCVCVFEPSISSIN